MDVGATIKRCRQSRAMTQKQLSEASGVAQQTISCAEINRSGTSVAILTELLNAMDYDLVVVDRREDNGEETQRS